MLTFGSLIFFPFYFLLVLSFGWTLQAQIRSTAQAMVDNGMLALGYDHVGTCHLPLLGGLMVDSLPFHQIVLDDCWHPR